VMTSGAPDMSQFGELPYRAREVGLNEAYEMALRKRDVAAVRKLERARATLRQFEESQHHNIASAAGGADLKSASVSGSPLSNLPYRASEIGIEAALEMANRKRDCKAVRMLERAKAGIR